MKGRFILPAEINRFIVFRGDVLDPYVHVRQEMKAAEFPRQGTQAILRRRIMDVKTAASERSIGYEQYLFVGSLLNPPQYGLGARKEIGKLRHSLPALLHAFGQLLASEKPLGGLLFYCQDTAFRFQAPVKTGLSATALAGMPYSFPVGRYPAFFASRSVVFRP